MTCEILQKHPEGLKIYNDFKKPASFYIETEFNDIIPTYNEFISNKKIKEVFGIIPISKVKDEIGTSFPKEISNQQLNNLKQAISKTNNKIKDYVYLLFNVKQRGQADLYTWGLRKVKGNLDIQAKLDRAIQQASNTIQSNDKIKDLQKKVDQRGIQGDLFNQRYSTSETNNNNQNSLFGLDTQNQENLEFHINTLNVVGQFLENVGVKQRLVPEFLSQNGNVVEGAIAAANFIQGTVDIIDDVNKRPSAWNKLPEEAAHWWYRLLNENSPLKKALWESHQTALKNDELYKGQYGKLVKSPSDLTEESIGQLIAEAIKRIETKNAAPEDYSFLKKFLEWINSIIGIFKNTTQDPFEVAAMKILSSDMSDLMTWEEYRKLNNIVNFADILTEQSVAPIDYTLIEDIGVPDRKATKDNPDDIYSSYTSTYLLRKSSTSDEIVSPEFKTREELDNWVYKKYGNLINERQKAIIQEVKDNQQFFDRLLNKSFRKKSKYLPKTLRKYFQIIDAQNLNPLREWNISQELQQITKKLSDFEKKQIIETNGYTNIAPTLKVLPDLLQKYKKNPIVLSEPVKIDGAKKQELSILNGIREMIKLENPNLKSITAEEFVAEAHNWLETNYLLGFANENKWLSYNVDQTFVHVKDRVSNEANPLANMTEEEINNLPFEERQRIANIVGLTKQNPDVYHNKVSLRFNDMYHLKSGHFDKSPSAWGNLTYFYTGKNKWKDAVLLHEIQNDNIEFLREFKAEKVDLETSLGRYLQQLNTDLLDNITQIESGGKRIQKTDIFSTNPPKQHLQLNYQLQQLVNQPLEQGLQQLKQNLNEKIELYKSDNSIRNNPEKAQEEIEKAYSQRRKFADFQKKGGIKSLLNKQELQNLKDVLNELNTGTVMTDAVYMPDENQYEPGYETIRNLKQKKQDFKLKTLELQAKITRELQKLYGDDAPLLHLEAPAKPLPKSQRRNQIVNRGTPRERRIGNASQELNENVNFLITFSEQQIVKRLSKTIEETKRNYIQARNATVAYNFNVQLSKITLEQWGNLVENYKYNEDLLNRLIDEQAQKDIKSPELEKIAKAKSIIKYLGDDPSVKLGNGKYGFMWDTADTEKGIVAVWDAYKNKNTNEDSYVDNWSVDEFLKYVKQVAPEYLTLDIKTIDIQNQQSKFETLKQKALDKKAELEKNYGKIEEEVKQTLEIEMNYFTPLVHHLIQKHINQYGKDFPMYFSGYNITKLTQGNDRTALIYAGKDEINIVDKNAFEFNGKKYQKLGQGAVINAGTKEELRYFKLYDEYKVEDKDEIRNVTEQEFNKAIQEYEKAYQQATERRAKEIKFRAAKEIGLLNYSDFNVGMGYDYELQKLTDKELEEGIKKLNEYKKQSKQNLDRVVNTIMNISNNKPIETGAIYNAMSQISGVKLIWQDKIEGLKDNPGGYLVDLTNYNYNVPILYGLESKKQNNQKSPTSETNNNNLQEGLQWLKQIMPDTEPVLVDGLIDNIANGSYDILNDLITLSKDYANKGIIKHEALHRIFNLLPKSEQEKLLNEGSKKYGIARGKSTATVRYNTTEIKPGVEELFDSNPELANQIYEALGFNKPPKFFEGNTLSIDNKTYTISEKISSKDLAKRYGFKISSNIPVYIVKENLGVRKGGYDTNQNIIILSENSDKETIEHELIHSVEYNLDKKELNSLYEEVKDKITEDSFKDYVSWNFKKSISEFIADGISKKVFRDALEKEGLLDEVDSALAIYKTDITPQQKQQALQLYSQYLESLNKPNTNPILQGNPEIVLDKDVKGRTEQELIEYLKQKYPKIKLDISNNPVWEQGNNVFNQLIEDDYFEGNFVKYQNEVEKISNLILNKLKFKLKAFNGIYDEKITSLEEYKSKILNDLLKEIGITGAIFNLEDLRDRLSSSELQKSLIENLNQAKESKENYRKQLESFYSTRRLLNNFLKHFDINKYDAQQQLIIKSNLPSLFKENKFKSDKQAIAFSKRQINSTEWANKKFQLDKISVFFLGQNAKINKIETLINYFKIDKQDAIERIYTVVENELNRRERFFTSEKIQSKINAKIAEDKIKADNEKAERLRRQNEELNKYKNSTVVQEVEGFLGSRNIHDLEDILESSNINIELAVIKNNGYSLDKTPEGKESNLFKSILNLPEVNGNVEIAKKLKSLVYSEDFTNWFGDWLNNPEESSKIIDENGEPKLVYHGSGREFSNFEEKERGSTTGKWKDRLSDSEMSFMFTDSPTTAFYYAIIERQQILKEITYYVRKSAQEPTNQIIQEMYQKYPSIKNWVDGLKQKGLTRDEILKEFNRVYQEYNKIRDLSEGGAIGNQEANNQNTKQIIDYLEKNKESILKKGIPKNDKYNTAIIPNSDKNGYPIWLWSSKEYNTISINNNGVLNNFSEKLLNGKNIKELSSSEYDLMVEEFKNNFIYNYEKIQDEIKAGGFRPKVYPVFLNAKNINRKDFKRRPFVFQQGDTEEIVSKRQSKGAAFEVADLIEESINNNLDGSIIENIADPIVSTNYAVFKSNQIKSVFNKKDYSSQDNFYNQLSNGKIIGQANIKAMTILVDAVNKKADTIPHEYAHHYIAWFRDTPIVQEGIKRFGSEEALVQAIGEQVVKQKGEAYNWWKKFTNWILSLLSDKQLLQILTDSFLNRQDLNEFTYNNIGTEQLKKFQELQERLSNKEFLEGAKNAFESSEELQQFGTQEQYNDYIARVSLGIIKNPSSGEYNYTSKVKDIVYHGSKNKIDKFSLEETRKSQLLKYPNLPTVDAFFLTPSKVTAKAMTSEEAVINSAVINSKNPLKVTTSLVKENNISTLAGTVLFTNSPEMISKYKKLGYDSFDSSSNAANELAVFEPEQIHILGSKQDIEGFKEFVKSPTVRYSQADQNKVNFGLKAVEILQSDKAKQVFEKGKKNKWDLNKILTELAIPKEQKQLILSLDKTNREEIITDLLANYSYTIEIKTAKENGSSFTNENSTYYDRFQDLDSFYNLYYISRNGEYKKVNEDGDEKIITQEEYDKKFETLYPNKDKTIFKASEQPSQEHKKLSARDFNNQSKYREEDGWEYQELSINTPQIENYKGSDHTPFTSFGGNYIGHIRVWYNKKTGAVEIQEVQSDLFQKGRGKEDLILKQKEDSLYTGIKQETTQELYKEAKNKGKEIFAYHDYYYLYNNKYYSYSSINNKYYVSENNSKLNTSENQFLQLLNKDNNWVTFFIKSIIQNSAKKGYEKVLFPTGNTASKVEGHTTLEEFKKQKEDRIKELENRKSKNTSKELEGRLENLKSELTGEASDDYIFSEISEIERQIVEIPEINKEIDNEINQLKQELERVETEGFGALKPIYNFYENTVTNILNKTYGKENVKQITDEYGNTWNEITLTPKMAETIRLNTPNGKIEYTGDLAIEEKIAEEAFNSKDEKVPTTLIGKFIQSIRNLFRNIFRERDNISRLIRDLNQGRFNLINKENYIKTEVEKILTEGDLQVKQLVTKPIEEVKLDKIKKPEVIKKMKEILNILGITTEISNLPEEIAAQADILNRLIKFADDSITEDNFTEETIHFIVEILEQKNKPLFDKMMSEIWKYKIYTDVKNEYSSLKQYQNENGRPDYYKIKKEAIGQLLTAKLLDTQEVKDEKNFIGGIWEAISKFIKSLFTSIPNQKRDAFQTTVDEILENPELIKQEDVQFLGQSSVFFSKKPSNKIASSLYKVKQKFGTASQTQFNKFNNNEEAWEYFKNLDSRIEKVTEKELNTQTNEYEDVEYYVFDGNKKQRVTTVIKEANNKTFANVSQDEQAQALREAKKQKGTEVHKTIEDILNRYIDHNTGEIRTTPLNRPLNLDIPKNAYDKLENHVQNRLATYPKGTKFLMETKVVNEEAGYAGTIDFLAFLPNGEVDILDWKTTDVSYWEAGVKRKRFDISPFNQTYWKTQLSFYKRALESHGIDEFRYTRAIPIALETKQTLIDKNKKYTSDNVVYQISNIEIGDSEPKKISKDLFYLTPVSVEDESTGIKELDDLIEKLQGIYDRIQKTTYSKEEAYKKKQELDRLNLAIREIQTKRTATFFTNLFTENFERFEKLTDKEFEFLKDVKGKKFLSQEQEQELHNYLNEVYSAIEFLQAFQDFPGVIGELYKEGELTDYEKEVKKAAVSIGGKAQTIGNQLIKNATSVIDQLGQLYNIDNTSGLDRKDTGLFTNFISILHREEKSIQFVARLLNAIKFLGNKEANEFFNEETGKYTLVYNGVQEWMKKNKKSLENVYSFLLNKDKEGKPIRELLSKIKSEFFTELQNKQTEFTNYYKSQQELLSDLGYKGVKYTEELNKTYKKHVESWLSFNFNISEYEKSYKEALEKYKESNKNVRLDEDDLINEEKKKKRLESWVEEHDVFSSPKALSPRNYLLYPNLSESKWYSEGYKNLLKPENKPLLDAYNLFTDLNKRAENNGMLDDILNAKRFVPNVVDPSLSRSAFEMLKEGGMSPFYAISKVADFFRKHLGFLKEVEPIDPQLDPLTKKQLRRIPVKYKYLQEDQEKDLSNDLFEIYAKWADHIIRYEMLSNYENRFKMVQLLESIKSKSFAVNNIGEIVRKKDKASQKTKKLDTIPKSKKIEEDLEKIINNYVYSSNLDVKPEFYKIANLLYDYTALNFLGINVTAWIANIVGASVSARLTEGKWFNKNDYLTIGINTTLGVFNKNIAKYGDNLYGKSKFLINKLDTRILSEYDRDFSGKYSKSKLRLGDVAFAGFRLGDHFIQDALASSIFLNTTIIDGKFVNINDLVKARYNKQIFNAKTSKERKELIKKRDKEIQELKEKSNLYRFVEEKNGKFSFKGIDLNSLEGQAQLISYQNKIASYIKQAVGNIDEWDKSINRMSWGMKFLMQFKNWMPRVFGARLQDIEYQYELDDYHYGRAKIAWDSFKLNTKDTLLEVIKNVQLLIPFVGNRPISQSIIDLAKSQYLIKKTQALNKNQQFDLTEEQFVDIYITGFNNALTELAILTQFALAVTFIGLAYSGSDDKDKWYWKILSRVIFKVNRELNSLYDPEQLIALGGKGAIPILGSLIQLYDLLGSYKDEIVGDIGQQLGIEGAEEKSKKAKPLSQTLKSTPILRELHYWLSATSEEYADFMEIEQPEVQIE